MATITAAQPASFDFWDGARALASSAAFTAGFTILYVALAPIALLGAVLAGPLLPIVVYVRESA
jgi:hypothetical protein